MRSPQYVSDSEICNTAPSQVVKTLSTTPTYAHISKVTPKLRPETQRTVR